MANLRITSNTVVDSKTIEFNFTEDLDSTISTVNISIVSLSADVPDATVTEVQISLNKLIVISTPLTPFAIYRVTLSSVVGHSFRSINGSILLEDGNTNAPLIQAAPDPDNQILVRLMKYYAETPYRTDIKNEVKNYLEGISKELYRARNTIGQVRSDNYISVTVTDEYHKRGSGPYDRLDNEGVYEITRVGQYTQDKVGSGSLTVASFPKTPISLQTQTYTETLTADNQSLPGTFNSYICSLTKTNITKITSLVITYTTLATVTTYNLVSYGYQLQNARYDSNASTYVDLETNQFKFSERAVEQGFILPGPGDTIAVSYEYKNLGIYVDPTTVEVYELLQEIREVAPPVATVFSLKNSNIVNSSGVVVTRSAVTVQDPYATPPYSTTHAAFRSENVFNENSLPAGVGVFSVDYENGKVYVFGSDTTDTNVGTGPYPPVFTYYYKKYYKSGYDYTYDPTLLEVVSNSERDLRNKSIVITFSYSENYVPEVDYSPQNHIEILAERIDNRLAGNNVITPEHSPVTDVFRIFNETTGEVYTLNSFDDNKIVFNYKNAPTILSIVDERANFQKVAAETLILTSTTTNTYSTNIWVFNLNNNSITAASNDCVGSSINTSITFSDTTSFANEFYFDRDVALSVNLNRLGSTFGNYCVDYDNGIVYVAIISTHTPNVGTISYQSKYIETRQDHILTINDVFTRIDLSSDKYKFSYNTFDDTKLDLLSYDISDNKEISDGFPIFTSSGTITLPRNALSLRGCYELVDLQTYSNPINFAIGSTISFSTASLVPVEFKQNSTVSTTTVSVSRIAALTNTYIDSVVYIKRLSDGAELYNTTLADGSFTGSTITLPSDTVGINGDTVEVSIMVGINDTVAVVADIDFGGLFVNYNFLYDEIIISYEYGDNVLDFRSSTTVTEDQEYYVSYKYGALRDGLYSNFGSIIDIDNFKNFGTDFERERYRDALSACLQNFPSGPTKLAISNIAEVISHIKPDIIESMYEEWVVGLSHLYDNDIISTGTLLPSIWDYGVYCSAQDEKVEVPIASHIKIDGGTTEFWVTPNWNGIDNDAELTFSILADGYVLDPTYVYLGANADNPTLSIDNTFDITRFSLDPDPVGIPYNIALDGYGVFVYYDSSENFWKVLGKGEVGQAPIKYEITILTNGEFYKSAAIGNTMDTSDVLRTYKKKIELTMNFDAYDASADGYDGANLYTVSPFSFDGVKFISDIEHYLFDYAETDNENRISVYKDCQGYLVLNVFSKKDRLNRAHSYKISHDISEWISGDEHHVAFSNVIGSKNAQDELHFFIDGFEVPNIIRWGGKPAITSNDGYYFRTVVPEVVVGTVPRNTVCGTDLVTVAGSNIVTSASTDFSARLISDFGGVGHTIYIEETGFAASYSINAILPGDNANQLKLSTVMPYSLSNARFSVNKWTAPVSTELMYEPNIAVSRYDGTEEELQGLRAANPAYAIEVDGYGQPSIVIRGDTNTGDQIWIRTLGMNHRRLRHRAYVWGSLSNIINLNLPAPITLDYAKVFPVTKSKYVMNALNRSDGYDGYATETIVGNSITTTGILADTQPSNNASGRTLSITASGDNIDYSIPATITLYGTTYSGATSEVITFSSSTTQDTTEYFKTVSSIDAYATATNIARATLSFEIKEKYQITKPENDGYTVIIRSSFMENAAIDLDGYDTDTIASASLSFYYGQIGNTLVISSPAPAAGSYIITAILDNHSITVTPAIPTFSNGVGKIYDVSISRSGFANGSFTFEFAGITPIQYLLNQGFYDFDYETYLEIPLELKTKNAILGNSFDGTKPAKAIIEEVRSLDYVSVDTRVGETLPSIGRSITTDATASDPFDPDIHTTLLLHMNEATPLDSSIPYERYSSEYLQFSSSLNDNFAEALCIRNNPYVLDNNGILNGTSGTIEFWVSPRFDSRNDNTDRYLFDACAVAIEEVTSTTKGRVIITTRAKEILSVQLLSDKSVTGTNYYEGGSLANDQLTISLGITLPSQQTPVRVTYIPYGTYGSRFSIYKDKTSNIAFSVVSDSKTYILKTPIFWSRDTWHRIMATWDFSVTRLGKMNLFVDGEEKIVITSGIIAGLGYIAGTIGPNQGTNLNISIKDQFQKLYVGSNYLGGDMFPCTIDNLKFSKVKKSPVYISGQPFDNDYSSNISTVLPVVEDLYTTYLSDFGSEPKRIEDFTIVKNSVTGIYDFSMKVFDSFDIISPSPLVKDMFEEQIDTLKPANSRAFIKYYK